MASSSEEDEDSLAAYSFKVSSLNVRSRGFERFNRITFHSLMRSTIRASRVRILIRRVIHCSHLAVVTLHFRISIRPRVVFRKNRDFSKRAFHCSLVSDVKCTAHF